MPVARAPSKSSSSRRAKLSSQLSSRASTERPRTMSSTSKSRTKITKNTPSPSSDIVAKRSTGRSSSPSTSEAVVTSHSEWLSTAHSLLLDITDTEDQGFRSEREKVSIRTVHLEMMEREPGYVYFFVGSLERHVRLWRAKPLLIQEQVRDDPWRLLVAVMLLNKTSGTKAIPIFWELMERWPSAKTMAKARADELCEIIRTLGLQRTRSARLIRLSQAYIDDPPIAPILVSSKFFAKLAPDEDTKLATAYAAPSPSPTKIASERSKHFAKDPDSASSDTLPTYPFQAPTSSHPHNISTFHGRNTPPSPHLPLSPPPSRPLSPSKNSSQHSCSSPRRRMQKSPSKSVASLASPILHLPGSGKYAIDSYRIFCGGIAGEDEWRHVRPEDKELIRYLKWRWATEGIEWSPEEGEVGPASDEYLDDLIDDLEEMKMLMQLRAAKA